MIVPELSERVRAIRERIARACEKSARDPSCVRLIAVTKTHGADTVRTAVAAGLTEFGENRVQEGSEKIKALRPDFPDLSWVLIGRLQTNKVKTALKYFREIQSVDRASLLEKIAREATAQGAVIPILLEVNIGGQESKGGVDPDGCDALLGKALAEPSLRVRGLMSVPPPREDPEDARPSFRELRELRDRLQERHAFALPELSMGMSHDFEVAVEEGATQVRIGTALFGERGDGARP
ncbi:MAG: YggS family pyridoxal phosphate-dependent enzyme [Thermoanaerobaculia bacterium]